MRSATPRRSPVQSSLAGQAEGAQLGQRRRRFRTGRVGEPQPAGEGALARRGRPAARHARVGERTLMPWASRKLARPRATRMPSTAPVRPWPNSSCRSRTPGRSPRSPPERAGAGHPDGCSCRRGRRPGRARARRGRRPLAGVPSVRVPVLSKITRVAGRQPLEEGGVLDQDAAPGGGRDRGDCGRRRGRPPGRTGRRRPGWPSARWSSRSRHPSRSAARTTSIR